LYKDTGIKGQFIDLEMSEDLFNVKIKDLSEGIYISILLIIFLSNIFSIEYSSGAINIINCSKNRTKLRLYKYLISFITIIILFTTVYLPDYINILHQYGTAYLKSPIQSIPVFYNFKPRFSIFQFLLFTNLFKFIGILFISIMILNLSILSKNQINTIILGTFILIPSIVLSIIGFNFLDNFSIVNIFNLNYSFSLKHSLLYNFTYFSALAIIMIFMQYITFSNYASKKSFKKVVNHEVRDKKFKQKL
jgi:hypothetical protein